MGAFEQEPEAGKVFVIGLEGFSLFYDADQERIVSELAADPEDSPRAADAHGARERDA